MLELWQSNREIRQLTRTEKDWLAAHGFFRVSVTPYVGIRKDPEPERVVVAIPGETAGDKLRRWRKANKLTLRQVSNRCEISIAYLSDLETGKLVNPSMRTLRAIAMVMGIDASELLR